ncbi:MAG: aspartate aminotransferase family protein [Acidobacteria bacterium]|nr:aspartate aminotransferase family protein [Acidobacteriota bacterium]
MTPDEFRRLGHEVVEWVAAYRESLESHPVMSQVSPGDVRRQLPAAPPVDGESLDFALSDLDRIVLPGITHWSHPRFLAYFPSNASLSSVLADLVATGLGVQGMSWQTSPAATELEEVVMDWLRQMAGLPAAFTGVIHDTASTATLVALLCARERATDHSQTRGGLQAEERPLAVYTSEQSHSSIEKAALLAGFGRKHVRAIGTGETFAVSVDELRAAIERDLDAGVRPCAIVATVGSTATTAVDPVAELAEIAAETGAWLHVDAALAGSAMILPECRRLWEGVDRADSLVFNPHKWLGAAFDCTAYFVRDHEHLIRVMSTNPSYLRTAVDAEVSNFRDWHIQLGRRFRSLKLWFLIREQGVSGLQARLRRDLANAQWLATAIAAEPGWEICAPVPLQTVCCRHVPAGLDDEAVDAHNQAWVDRLNASGFAYLTPAVVKGRRIVRVSIGSEATERKHVEEAWAAMRRTVEHM